MISLLKDVSKNKNLSFLNNLKIEKNLVFDGSSYVNNYGVYEIFTAKTVIEKSIKNIILDYTRSSSDEEPGLEYFFSGMGYILTSHMDNFHKELMDFFNKDIKNKNDLVIVDEKKYKEKYESLLERPQDIILERCGIYTDFDYVDCIGKKLGVNGNNDKNICENTKKIFPDTRFNTNCSDCIVCIGEILEKINQK